MIYLKCQPDLLFYYIHVLITQLVLTQLQTNGDKLHLLWNKTNSSPLLIVLIKDMLVDALIKIELLLTYFHQWEWIWFSPNLLPKIWDYMDTDVVPFILYVQEKTLLQMYSLKLNWLLDQCIQVHPDTEQLLQLEFWTLHNTMKNGKLK